MLVVPFCYTELVYSANDFSHGYVSLRISHPSSSATLNLTFLPSHPPLLLRVEEEEHTLSHPPPKAIIVAQRSSSSKEPFLVQQPSVSNNPGKAETSKPLALEERKRSEECMGVMILEDSS